MACFAEFSTTLLIAKRVVEYNVGTRDNIVYKLLDAFFVAAWVIFRLIGLPLFLVGLTWEYKMHSEETGSYLTPMALGPVCAAGLLCMTYHWTIKLFRNRSGQNKRGEKKRDE